MNKIILLLGVMLLMFNCAGTRPTNLGVKEGKLLKCPNTPNCVSSQCDTKDSHYITPFTYSQDITKALSNLKELIEKQPRTKIISSSENYINAEFTSFLMGYVDDVEFYFDDVNKTIHIRSASRLGKSDLGANRKRIESIRSQLIK